MTKEVTLRQAGGSVSARLPKDMADRLRLEAGDRVLAVETDRGVLLTPPDAPPETRPRRAARKAAKKDRDPPRGVAKVADGQAASAQVAEPCRRRRHPQRPVTRTRR